MATNKIILHAVKPDDSRALWEFVGRKLQLTKWSVDLGIPVPPRLKVIRRCMTRWNYLNSTLHARELSIVRRDRSDISAKIRFADEQRENTKFFPHCELLFSDIGISLAPRCRVLRTRNAEQVQTDVRFNAIFIIRSRIKKKRKTRNQENPSKRQE